MRSWIGLRWVGLGWIGLRWDAFKWLIASCFVLGMGCQAHIPSPPARAPGLDSPATVGEGESSVMVAAGAVTGGSDGFGGKPVFVGNLRGRYGLQKDLDLLVDASAFRVFHDDEVRSDGSRWIGGLHARAKYRVFEHLAIAGGLGGGVHGFGGFVAPEASIIAGYENDYFVPTLETSVSLSLPVAARTGFIRYNNGDVLERHEPQTTFIWSISPGARVPVYCGKAKVSLLLGLHLIVMHSFDPSEQEQFDTANNMWVPGNSDVQFVGSIGGTAGIDVAF